MVFVLVFVDNYKENHFTVEKLRPSYDVTLLFFDQR